MGKAETRTGVLVIRAWLEGDSKRDLRARVISTLDTNRNESESRVAASVDDVTNIVHEWLNELIAAADPVTRR